LTRAVRPKHLDRFTQLFTELACAPKSALHAYNSSDDIRALAQALASVGPR
jgi:hypothetical protein